MMKKSDGHTEARKFLRQVDGDPKVFEVEWVKRVSWFVEASSREEAKAAAHAMDTFDLDFDLPEINVSIDLVFRAKKISEKLACDVNLPVPDSGVFKDEIIHIDEYVARRVWALILERAGNSVECPECGCEGWTTEFCCNPPDKKPKYGYIPRMGCPRCKAFIDWRDLVENNPITDDKTLPLFEEEGKGDGEA